MDSSHIRLAKKLKSLRRKQKITQEELAQKASLNVSYIGRIENGKQSPTLSTLLRISRALGVSVSELLDILSPESPFRENEPLIEKIVELLEQMGQQELELTKDIARDIITNIGSKG